MELMLDPYYGNPDFDEDDNPHYRELTEFESVPRLVNPKRKPAVEESAFAPGSFLLLALAGGVGYVLYYKHTRGVWPTLARAIKARPVPRLPVGISQSPIIQGRMGRQEDLTEPVQFTATSARSLTHEEIRRGIENSRTAPQGAWNPRGRKLPALEANQLAGFHSGAKPHMAKNHMAKAFSEFRGIRLV